MIGGFPSQRASSHKNGPLVIYAYVLNKIWHYSDVIMGAMGSQITCVSFVCSTVCSGTDQRKHQTSASLVGDRWIPLTKGQWRRKCFHLMTWSWITILLIFISRLAHILHCPDSKVHGANMGPTWVLSAPDGPHVGPMSLAIRVFICALWWTARHRMSLTGLSFFNLL